MSRASKTRTDLREFLQTEDFWIRNYSARLIREDVLGAALFLSLSCIVVICIAEGLCSLDNPRVQIYAVTSLLVNAFAILVLGITLLPRPRFGLPGEHRDVSHEDQLITREIRHLARSMHCSQPLRILVALEENHWIPSVSRVESGVHALIVPAGLMLRTPAERRAVLAHELAHIKHDDVDLWLASDRISLGLRIASLSLFSFLVASIVVAPMMGFVVSGSNVGNYAVILLKIAGISRRVKTFRQYSETRADFAAVAYADGQAFQSMLTELAVPPAGTDSDHRKLADFRPTRAEKDWDYGNHPDALDRLQLVGDATRYWASIRHSIGPNQVCAPSAATVFAGGGEGASSLRAGSSELIEQQWAS